MKLNLSEENWQYYLGNHRQFYSGRSLPKNNPLYNKFNQELDRIFNSYNVCSEIVNHYVNTLVGQPFNWSIRDNQGRVCETAEKIFSQWLDWQSEMSTELDLGDPLAKAVTQMLVGDRGDGIGSGYLRVYSPGIFSNLEPFQQILFHCPNFSQIDIKRNLDGIAYQANYSYGKDEVETYTLLNDGRTLIESENNQVIANYHGLLPVFELNGKCLLTDAIKRGQNAINNALTYKSRNLEATGYIERLILNAQPPGEWRENSQTGNLEFSPDRKPIEVGSNIATFITGMPIGDPRNPTGYTSPSINYKYPVPPSTFIESIEIDCAKIYSQAGLTYLISSDLGSMSGASRQSLRDDFSFKLGIYQRTIEVSLKRLFSIAIDALADSYPIFKGCKPIVKLNLALTTSMNLSH